MFKRQSKMHGVGKENIAPPWHKRFSDAVTASSVYSNHSNGTVVQPLFSAFSELSPPSSPEQLNGPETGGWDAVEDVSPLKAVRRHSPDNSNKNQKTYATPSVLTARDPNSRGTDYSQQAQASNYGGKTASKGNTGLGITTEPREPWKGASGRFAVLPPLVDKPLPIAKRLILPRRSSKRPTSLLIEPQLEVRPLSIVPRSSIAVNGSSGIDCSSSDEEEEIKPIPPLKVSRKSLSRSATPSSRKSLETTAHPTRSSTHDLTPATRPSSMEDAKTYLPISAYQAGYTSPLLESVDSVKPLVAAVETQDTQQQQQRHDQQEQQPVSRFSWTTAATSTAYPHRESLDTIEPLREAAQMTNVDEKQQIYEQQQQEQQPVSRFSWTTAAASAAYQSPPDTPVLAYEGSPPTPRPASSILDRKRPIPSPSFRRAPNHVAATSRKPTPSQLTFESSVSPSDSISQYDRRSSTICTQSKALPLSPPELESVDLVTSLQAQLDDLRLRRGNLQKLVDRSTQLQPQNPVVQDLAKRRQAKEEAKALERDIESLRREEYEVGLRMHRAWRRRERGTEGPSVLWVRRVTA